jgi:hypothetical protein
VGAWQAVVDILDVWLIAEIIEGKKKTNPLSRLDEWSCT